MDSMKSKEKAGKKKVKNLYFLKGSMAGRKIPNNNNKIVIIIRNHYLP